MCTSAEGLVVYLMRFKVKSIPIDESNCTQKEFWEQTLKVCGSDKEL